eukprot:COSAG01_NODE_7617_length_3125_cov_3.377396_5_plen_66_part_00
MLSLLGQTVVLSMRQTLPLHDRKKQREAVRTGGEGSPRSGTGKLDGAMTGNSARNAVMHAIDYRL